MPFITFLIAVAITSITLAFLARYVIGQQNKREFTRRIILTITLIICLALVTTLLWGPFVPFFLLLLSTVIGLSSLIVGIVLVVSSKGTIGKAWVAFASLLMIAWVVSGVFDAVENSTTKSYCESLLNELETYKGNHGAYPDDLGEIQSDVVIKPLRAILVGDKTACGYRKSENNTFLFVVRKSVINDWVYLSHSGTWTTND